MPTRRLLLLLAILVCAALAGCSRDATPEDPPAAPDDCTGLDAERCIQQGIALQEGTTGPADPASALALYLQTCQGGDDARGCTLAGNLLARGAAELTADPARALALYDQACEANDPWGCFHAGNAYGLGKLGTPKDPDRALTRLRRSCEHGGPPEACEFAEVVARIVEMPSPDEREATCRAGDGRACHELGMDLRDGRRGLDAEPDRALDVLLVGCEAHDGGSCALAGLMVEKNEVGRSPIVDTTAVDRLYARACDAGFMMGCRALGRHLLTGTLLPRDEKRGVPLLERACHAERDADLESCTWLGVAYEKGLGVQANAEQARQLYARACTEGHHELACEILSEPL